MVGCQLLVEPRVLSGLATRTQLAASCSCTLVMVIELKEFITPLAELKRAGWFSANYKPAPPITSATEGKRPLFHWLICVGCTSYFAARACTVSMPLSVSRPTFALNSGVNLRRFFLDMV